MKFERLAFHKSALGHTETCDKPQANEPPWPNSWSRNGPSGSRTKPRPPWPPRRPVPLRCLPLPRRMPRVQARLARQATTPLHPARRWMVSLQPFHRRLTRFPAALPALHPPHHPLQLPRRLLPPTPPLAGHPPGCAHDGRTGRVLLQSSLILVEKKRFISGNTGKYVRKLRHQIIC